MDVQVSSLEVLRSTRADTCAQNTSADFTGLLAQGTAIEAAVYSVQIQWFQQENFPSKGGN